MKYYCVFNPKHFIGKGLFNKSPLFQKLRIFNYIECIMSQSKFCFHFSPLHNLPKRNKTEKQKMTEMRKPALSIVL